MSIGRARADTRDPEIASDLQIAVQNDKPKVNEPTLTADEKEKLRRISVSIIERIKAK